MSRDLSMLPQYSTILFTDVWESAADFKTDFAASPFDGCISDEDTATTKDNVSLVYYLLYAKYGNNPIANRDVNQFKTKVQSIIFSYGPTWEKRLDIQDKLRKLSDDDIRLGSKSIYNNALNPSDAPGTGTLEELDYINAQNTANHKRGKLDGYAMLWDLLATDVTTEFISKFKVCFKTFVRPEKPLLYMTEDEEDQGE